MNSGYSTWVNLVNLKTSKKSSSRMKGLIIRNKLLSILNFSINDGVIIDATRELNPLNMEVEKCKTDIDLQISIILLVGIKSYF